MWPKIIFSNDKEKQLGKASGTELILQVDRNLFVHMILAAERRKLDIKDVIAHPLGPIPWALATPDGSQRKPKKANVGVAQFMPTPSPCVIDRIGLIQ